MLGCLPADYAAESARCLQANRIQMSLAAHLVHHISAWCLWAACTGLIWVAISWAPIALGSLRVQRHGGTVATLAWHIKL